MVADCEGMSTMLGKTNPFEVKFTINLATDIIYIQQTRKRWWTTIVSIINYQGYNSHLPQLSLELPSVQFLTTVLTKSTLTQVSSLPQLFLQSKSMVNRHELSVCCMNDEVCYVNRQTKCLRTAHINDLIQEVKSMQLITHRNSQDTASTTKSRSSDSQATSSIKKSSFSRSDDDNSHTQSNSAPVSSIRRLHSNGSDTDSSAPSLSSCSYTTSQDDSDCESSFGSCDNLG